MQHHAGYRKKVMTFVCRIETLMVETGSQVCNVGNLLGLSHLKGQTEGRGELPHLDA
jgi:hypothetical protein